MELKNQAKFHPLKYLNSLIDECDKNGVMLFEKTEALSIDEEDDFVTVKTTGKNSIKAKHVIIATHNPFDVYTIFVGRLHQCNSYVINLEIPKDKIKEALYWDTEEPYHYMRIDSGENFDSLILGGVDHRTGEENISIEERYKSLEEYIKQILPDLNYKLVHKWSGQVIESVDGLPFIGFVPGSKRKLIGTGFAGNGMTYGTLTAKICSDLINGQSNKYENLFSTSRLKNIAGVLKEGAAYVNHMIKRPFEGEDISENDIQNNSGAVINKDGKKIAIYKDGNGKVIRMSAICTHMGCVVEWNNDSKTWDCPCHGSRFEKTGEVLNGPAEKPLI